jgi:hypothetical protein
MFSHLQTVKGDVLTRRLILLFKPRSFKALYRAEGIKYMFNTVRISLLIFMAGINSC